MTTWRNISGSRLAWFAAGLSDGYAIRGDHVGIQEILETQSSSSPPSPLSTEECATIKKDRDFTGAKSAIKGKGGIELWNPSHKRSKIYITDFPHFGSQTEDIRRELNAAEDQAKVLEKKIYALDIKIQILAKRISTREEGTGNRKL